MPGVTEEQITAAKQMSAIEFFAALPSRTTGESRKPG